MTNPKQKQSSALREPKPKKKLGLSVPPPLKMPHEELITPPAENKSVVEQTMPSHTTNRSRQPVSPERDFTKVANSITREAIPAGLFAGKSKQLYDYLYSVTRGAVAPSRSVRMSRPKLMKASGIGSRVTFDVNVERLVKVGLLSVRTIAGEHKGNEYMVFLPEEIAQTMPSQTSLTSLTGYAQKLDRLVRLETSQTRHSSSLLESTISEVLKTSLKTTTDDDDGITDFSEIFRQAAIEVFGEGLPKTEQERERWRECAEVLAEELRRAGKRAGAVSSIPAFFAAHLRRRFKSATAEKTIQPDRQLSKSQAAVFTREQKLAKLIKEIRMLHIGDAGYEEADLIEDLKYKCERQGIEWDEELVSRLLEQK